jgi:hypothetical protein
VKASARAQHGLKLPPDTIEHSRIPIEQLLLQALDMQQ